MKAPENIGHARRCIKAALAKLTWVTAPPVEARVLSEVEGYLNHALIWLNKRGPKLKRHPPTLDEVVFRLEQESNNLHVRDARYDDGLQRAIRIVQNMKRRS